MKEIALTRGLVALVDDDDYADLAEFEWQAHAGHGLYARRRVNGDTRPQRHELMHRRIMLPSEGMEIDHINGNGLDNQRHNLRLCTHEQNCKNRKMNSNNTSGFKGVSEFKGKWQAHIRHEGRLLHLGTFLTAAEAGAAYQDFVAHQFGEFASRDNARHLPARQSLNAGNVTANMRDDDGRGLTSR